MVSRRLDGLDEAIVQLLDAALTPIVAVDPDGLIGHVNAPAVDQYGYLAEELLGEPLEVLLPDQLRTAHGVEPRLQPGLPHPGPDQRGDRACPRPAPAVRGDLPHRRGPRRLPRCLDRRPEGGQVVRVASAGALEEYVEQLRIVLDEDDPRGRGPTALAMREGRPYFSGDFGTDAATGPWQQLAATYGIAASATVPLRCGGRVVAVLSLYSARTHVFDEPMRELLLGMAQNLSFSLDGFDRQRRLVEVAQERTQLAERLIAAQEEERGRIAADLHGQRP